MSSAVQDTVAADAATNTDTQPFLIAGQWRVGALSERISSPWSDMEGAEVAVATAKDVDDAFVAAENSRIALSDTSRSDRAETLLRLADLVERDAPDLVELLITEVGKTAKDAQGEVARTVSTIRFGADAAKTLVGEILPLDAMEAARNKFGYTVVEPIGTVVGIPAANFPLLISAHKIAPAIGAGCPLVMKAPDRTPRIVLRLASLVLEAGWPAAGLSVLTGGPEVGQALVEDDRPRLISFTGSSAVGKLIAARAGFKRLLLELGSNAATIVCESADVQHAATRIVAGAFGAAGQSCISVQRVYVHRSRRAELEEAIVALTGTLRVASEQDRTADVGPVLTDQAAARIESMITESCSAGAKVLVGGSRSGRFIEPTVLTGMSDTMPLHTEEIFGPVLALAEFGTIEEAIALANDSRYGLQAGIFTDSAKEAQLAAKRLEVGGVHINEISMWRADHMPYGGIKDSGFGKEGPASAMREMSVFKVVSWVTN